MSGEDYLCAENSKEAALCQARPRGGSLLPSPRGERAWDIETASVRLELEMVKGETEGQRDREVGRIQSGRGPVDQRAET